MLLQVSILLSHSVWHFVLCTPLRRFVAEKPAYQAWFTYHAKLKDASGTTLLVCLCAMKRLNQHGSVIESSRKGCGSSFYVLPLNLQFWASSDHFYFSFWPTHPLLPNCLQTKFLLTSMHPKCMFSSTGMDSRMAYQRTLKSGIVSYKLQHFI